MTPRVRALAACAALTLFVCSAGFAAPRVVLFEEITSATCPPCYTENPIVKAMLEEYGDQVAAVKWHVWWPSPGDDWWYRHNSPVVQWRIGDFYQGVAAPSCFIDGGVETLIDRPTMEAQIDARLATPSQLALSGTAEVTQAGWCNISVDVDVETPVAGLANTLYVVITEEQIDTFETPTGTITAGSNVITNMSSTEGIVSGLAVRNVTGLPSPTRISSVDSDSQVTLFNNASLSGDRTLLVESLNRERAHYDVFRRVNNNDAAVRGELCDLTAIGLQQFSFTLPVHPEYDTDLLHVVAWVQNMAGTGTGDIYQSLELVPSLVTAVGESDVTVARLGKSVPNPSSGATRIPFVLAAGGDVRLTVHDVTGRLVRELAAGALEAGSHEARWDGRDGAAREVPNGVYYYRLRVTGADLTGRMVLTR